MDVAVGVQPLLPVSPRVPLLRQPGVTPKTMVGGMYFVDDLRTVDDIESLEVIFYIQLESGRIVRPFHTTHGKWIH